MLGPGVEVPNLLPEWPPATPACLTGNGLVLSESHLGDSCTHHTLVKSLVRSNSCHTPHVADQATTHQRTPSLLTYTQCLRAPPVHIGMTCYWVPAYLWSLHFIGQSTYPKHIPSLESRM